MYQVVGASQTSKNIADRQVFCVLFYVQSRQIFFALKDEFCFQVQRVLSPDFRIRIIFKLKSSFLTASVTTFGSEHIDAQIRLFQLVLISNTGKVKKLNLGLKLFAPKSGNRCHYWAALGPAKGICKDIQSKAKNKSNNFSCYSKNRIFCLQENNLMVLLDEVLQWRNVKQKPFRQI